MGKALFFDIDGTLVNFRGQMPDSARRALLQAQKNGHLLVICSGRSPYQIYPWLVDMGFDGIIGAAGAYVECGGKVVYEHFMDKEDAATVCGLLHDARAVYTAQTKSGLVLTAENKRRMEERFRAMGASEEMMEQMDASRRVDEHPGLRMDIQKFTFFESQIPLAEIQERLRERFDVTALSFDRPTDKDGEISSRGINKALGIQKFIEYAGISREDTAAFGDGANDYEMLEYAQMGIAMGNGSDELKARANFVTRDIDDGGIAYALEELGLV